MNEAQKDKITRILQGSTDPETIKTVLQAVEIIELVAVQDLAYQITDHLIDNNLLDGFLGSLEVRWSGWVGPTSARSDEPADGGYWDNCEITPGWGDRITQSLAEIDDDRFASWVESTGGFEAPDRDTY